MSEEQKDAGKKLTDEVLEEATGGVHGPAKTMTCSNCGFSQTYTVIPISCPNCGHNWFNAPPPVPPPGLP